MTRLITAVWTGLPAYVCVPSSLGKPAGNEHADCSDHSMDHAQPAVYATVKSAHCRCTESGISGSFNAGTELNWQYAFDGHAFRDARSGPTVRGGQRRLWAIGLSSRALWLLCFALRLSA